MMRLLLTSGTGPVAVRQSVGELADAVVAALPELGVDLVSIHRAGDAAAPRSVALMVASQSVAVLQPLLGTHAFVRVGRSKRARKRWFVGVRLLPALPDTTVELDPREVHIRADRAGGPGGQHVNTTASAVRATHLPSGLSVRVAGERSQARNRVAAIRLLAGMLEERAERSRSAAARAAWLGHHRLERGRAVVEWRGPVTVAGVVALARCGGGLL